MSIRSALLLATSAVAAVAPMQAMAWGKEGHAIVAAIAEAHLTPAARAQVQQLLSVEPGATMESVAGWADEVRNKATSKWHFVNFPAGDCNYQPPVECSNGECLVGGFTKVQRVLADTSAPLAEREKALKYVIHLAGDAVQPLHDWGPDRGGNKYQVRYDGRGTNIHHVWDTELIKTYATGAAGIFSFGRPNYNAFAKRLITDSNKLQVSATTNPITWVEGACQVANRQGIFPPSRYVDASYANHWRLVVELQLIEGGMNLAAVLNQTLR